MSAKYLHKIAFAFEAKLVLIYRPRRNGTLNWQVHSLGLVFFGLGLGLGVTGIVHTTDIIRYFVSVCSI